MFCPSCGSENTGLPYCNRCGANLSMLNSQPQQVVQVNVTKPVVIIAATLAIFTLGGFGALIGGALTLARVVNGNDPLIAMIFFGMIIILTVDIFLARQLSKLISTSLSSAGQPRPPQPLPIATRLPAQLQQPIGARLQAPSVTENTTRFFEPAPTYRAPSETDELAAAKTSEK